METFIVRPESKAQATAVKAVLKALNVAFEKTTDKPYKADFIDKIKKSDQEFDEGRFKTMKTEDLWK